MVIKTSLYEAEGEQDVKKSGRYHLTQIIEFGITHDGTR